VRTNAVTAFSSVVPRQKITPTPYAIYAAGAAAAGSLSGFGASNFWHLSGNAGATPGPNFLGTVDNLPLEFKVNGTRALRLEPNPNAPNVIGGSAANEVTNGNYGAVIGGGGSISYPNRVGAIFGTVVGGAGNTASGNSATAMGQFNTASGYAGTAMGYYTVAAGFGSQAGGSAAKANHDGTFVWADSNFADFASTGANQFLIRAAGGMGINTSDPNGAALAVNGNVTVNNTIGTAGNQALELKVNGVRGFRIEPTARTDTVNVVGGSGRNSVDPGVVGATIGGGGSGDAFGGDGPYTNRVQADFATVSGGQQNTIEPVAAASTIGGGSANTIQNSADGATISGGGFNTIAPFAECATIGGGIANTILPGAWNAAIGGGRENTIYSNAFEGTLGGGFQNRIESSTTAATIGGGHQNVIQNNTVAATIGGGYYNFILPNVQYATIPGGIENAVNGDFGFAAGCRAKANHIGAFVWADSTEADFASTSSNQFAIRAGGGVQLAPQTSLFCGQQVRQMLNLWGTRYGIGVQSYTLYFRTDDGAPGGGFAWYEGGTHNDGKTNSGGGSTLMTLDTSGLRVNGTLVSSSDRNLKAGFTPVDAKDILDKVVTLPLSRWHYTNDLSTPHLGPMAQDFYAAFALGTDDKHIATVDAEGVALAAIQGLNQKLEEKEARISALEKTVAQLKTLIQQPSESHGERKL
jgi:trimeric autotransporter adhesin